MSNNNSDGVIIENILEKKVNSRFYVSFYHKRLFKLIKLPSNTNNSNDIMYCYRLLWFNSSKNQQDRPVGVLLGEWITDIKRINNNSKDNNNKDKTKQDCIFQISAEYNDHVVTFEILTADKDECDEWIKNIENVIENNRFKGTEHDSSYFSKGGNKFWKHKEWLDRFQTNVKNKQLISASSPAIMNTDDKDDNNNKSKRRPSFINRVMSMPHIQMSNHQDINDHIETKEIIDHNNLNNNNNNNNNHNHNNDNMSKINIKSIFSNNDNIQNTFTGHFNEQTFIQSTLMEIFQEHWNDWSEYFNHQQLLLASLELLLLYVDLENNPDHYDFIQNVIRVRCNLAKKDFDYLENGLRIGEHWMIQPEWKREKTYATYRIMLICEGIERLQSSIAVNTQHNNNNNNNNNHHHHHHNDEDKPKKYSWLPNIEWMKRQLAIVVACILSVFVHETSNRSEMLRNKILEYSIMLRVALEQFDEWRTPSSYKKVEDVLKNWLLHIKQCETITILTLSNYSKPIPLVPYPIDMRALFYRSLVYTCYEQVELDSLDDDSDNSESTLEPSARIHHHYKKILQTLDEYRYSKYFRLPISYHQLCFLSVIIDVVSEQVIGPVTAIDVLASNKNLLNIFNDLSKNLQQFDETEARLQLLSSRIEDWCIGSIFTWLTYFHFASRTKNTVKILLNTFINILKNIRHEEYPLTEIARAYFQAATVQLDYIEKTIIKNNNWNEIEQKIMLIIKQDLNGDDEVFTNILKTSGTQFFIAGIINTLCNKTKLLIKKKKTKDIDQQIKSCIQIVKNLQKLMVEKVNIFHHDVIKITLEESTVTIENICSNVIKRYLTKRSDRLGELRERCVQLDQWIAINEKNPHSSSVMDLFRILHSIQGHVFDLMNQMAPYGVYQLHYFLAVIESAIIKYCTMVRNSCGYIKCVSGYDDNNSDLSINFTEQGIMKYLLNSNKRQEKSKNHLTRMIEKENTLLNQSLSSLCVRLSCLVLAKKELEVLMDDIINQWELFDRNLRHSKNTHGLLHDYLPPQPELPEADNFFQRGFKILQSNIRNLCIMIAVHVVHHDIFEYLHDKIYRPIPSIDNNIDNCLESLDEIMGMLYNSLPDSIANDVAKYVFEELIGAWKWLILNRTGELKSNHAEIFEKDLLEICELFYTELDIKGIGERWKELYKFVKAIEFTSDELLTLVKTKSTLIPIPIEDILSILKHRDKRTRKYVTKNYDSLLSNTNDNIK